MLKYINIRQSMAEARAKLRAGPLTERELKNAATSEKRRKACAEVRAKKKLSRETSVK